MTKAKKESPQQNLFEWVRRAEALAKNTVKPSNGSLDIDSELRSAISQDIKTAKDATGRELSRYEIVARMSELVGQEITKSMLDNWSAESHEKHRFPCQYLPAFVIATGGRAAFTVLSRKAGLFALPGSLIFASRLAAIRLSRKAGLFALPGPEALRAEIQRLDEEIKRKKKEKDKRMIFLKEIEHGK